MRSSVEPPEGAASELRYRILGPLEVLAGDRPLNLGGVRPRRVIAALLLTANRPVSLFHLVEAVWEGTPPNTARRQVQNAIAALRAVLARAGAGEVITTHGSGYLLRVGPDRLDSLVFERLVERARAAADAGDGPGAATTMREALGLWRGPVLAGLGGHLYDLEAARLDEKRLVALEEVIEWELAAGSHARLVSELRALVAEHPLRERFTGQLMVALYRGGRQAEALAAYHDLVRHLDDELGLDPGPAMRRRYEMVLREDPELNAPDRPGTGAADGGTPAQLPRDVAAFTGRGDDLARLDQSISGGYTEAAVVISAGAGTVGVGKTALAVHWAHLVRESFPDGQLYVNLHGYSTAPPVRSIDALARFLRALGVPPSRVPTDQDEAAAMYRSLLADRRLLVLLDNARSPEQVRPLLPGNRECLVLVTSRDQLGGLVALDGARRLTLDVMSAQDAVDLLGRALGPQRVAAEPAAATRLARDCAYLPLALCIAAASLLTPAWQRIEPYAGRLAAALAAEQDPVRAAFDLSYAALPEPAQRMFRLLGLVPGPDVTPEAAAALADVAEADGARLLAELADRRLIDEYAPGRFALHDLLRGYAAELAAGGTDSAAQAATRRLYDLYLRGVDAAAQALYPVMVRLPLPAAATGPAFDNQTRASRWLDAERPNLVAAVAHAAGHAARRDSWLLADALRGYFWLRMHTVDWQAVGEVALEAAEADGDARASAAAHLSLGLLCHQVTRHRDAIEHYSRALVLTRQSAWTDGESASLNNLGQLYLELGRLEEAVEHVQQSLVLDRASGDQAAQAVNLSSLALMYAQLGRLRESLDHSREALELCRAANVPPRLEREVLGNLGTVHHQLGDFAEAFDFLDEALAVRREVSEVEVEAVHICKLAWLNLDAGRVEEAGRLGRAALTFARENGQVLAEPHALNVLGAVAYRQHEYPAAADRHQQALRLARDSEGRWSEAQALTGLAMVRRRTGVLDRAMTGAERAVALARDAGYRVLEGQARHLLAAIALDRDELSVAADAAEAALALHVETGHRLGQARTNLLLGRIRRRAGNDPAARAHFQAALAVFTEIGTPEAATVRSLLVPA